ncbi:AAA family ATPase [Streptococcaceae bacterium ESL0687]|nr:AAA family ATPase [Streptococcaceae bacterium ESL0687]
MKKIFGYSKINRKKAISQLEGDLDRPIEYLKIDNLSQNVIETLDLDYIVYDLSSLIVESSQSCEIIETFLQLLQSDEQYVFVVERLIFDKLKYSLKGEDIEFEILEEKLGIKTSGRILDLGEAQLDDLESKFSKLLIGHPYFKKRLFEELRKFRLFNFIDDQDLVSCLILGESGIGKTEAGRILSKELNPNSGIIKINLGNYSGQESLSSLIGSPRGYKGSEEGELSSKILNNSSSVIIIDEFEKSSGAVKNFFLELLEDGKFTDSLGREFDLSGYIIIFTSNSSENELLKHFSPELLSRFNLIFELTPLSLEEKQNWGMNFEKITITKIIEKYPGAKLKYSDLSVIDEINWSRANIRNLKNEIKNKIAAKYYEIIDKDK